MCNVQVRRYHPADRPAAMALAPRLREGVADWRDPDAVGDAVCAWVAGSLGTAEHPDRTVLVAVDGHELLGLVSVSERRHFSGQLDGYIGELVVAASAVRRGVASTLMAAAEDWARRRGLAFLTLETGAANRTARAFYEALGYAEEDVRLTKRVAKGAAASDGQGVPGASDFRGLRASP